MRPRAFSARSVARFVLIVFASLLPAVGSAQVTSTWTGGGSDNNWSTAGNWSGAGVPTGDTGNTVLVFSGSTRTTNNNNNSNWNPGVGQLYFASGAASFTLSGNPFGFRAYLGNGTQQIFQNSANTQTIAVSEFSFREDADSRINLNAGDLVISSPIMYIDMSETAFRQLYISGSDSTRRTVTFAGNVNRGNTGSGNNDPDLVIQSNKRVLVTGSLNNGRGTDESVYIQDGVLEFAGTGAMTGGRPVVGWNSGTGNAALFLNAGGSSFAQQIEIRGGSSGRRIVGGLNTSGTATFSNTFISTNSPANLDLAAATGGVTNFAGSRNFTAGLFVNRPDGATVYGGTVILSGTTNSTDFTALEAGTLQIGDFNQIGSGHFEFNAASGDSGTLRYTGGSTTTTKTLWVDNAGITRAAIDVSQAGTTLTWNPGSGNVNQNFTKTGAGQLSFGGGITGGTVNVEQGLLVLTGSNSYSGGTTVSGGKVEVSAFGSPGGSTAGLGTGLVSVSAGATAAYWLSANGTNTVANAFSLSGGELFTADGATTYSGALALASGTSTISARYEDTITLSGNRSGAGSLLFTQAGGTVANAAPTFVLSGTGGNTGSVRVTGSNGGGATKLQLANVNALQSATLDLATGDVGTVEFTVSGSNTYALGGLQGSRNLAFGSNSLSVGGNGQSTAYSGGLSGSGLFTKLGSGTLTLSGSNSHTGGTTVSGGRLAVNGTLGNTAVSVQSGGDLGGSGSIAGPVSVLAGGTLSPGNSIESLAVGSTVFSGASTFAYEYDSTTPSSPTADLLVVNGGLTIDAGAILTLADLAASPQAFANYTTSLALINYSGTWNGGLFTFGGSALADGGWFKLGNQEWQIDYDRTSVAGLANFTGDYLPGGSFVAITAVPEPSTWGLAVAGLAAGGVMLRRRRIY